MATNRIPLSLSLNLREENPMMQNRSWLFLAVLAAGGCSRESVPTSSGSFAGPSLVRDSGVSSSARAPLAPGNCTLTQGFWKNHASDWPLETLVLGGVTYSKAEAIAVLRTAPRGDATYILIHQLIAATLNVAHGADPSAVQATLDAAEAWLGVHALGSKPTSADRDEGVALAATLDDFNNGRIGPGHCDEATPTPTANPTPTETTTPTPTATETPTVEPTPTEPPPV
jgi:hypothetical protein